MKRSHAATGDRIARWGLVLTLAVVLVALLPAVALGQSVDPIATGTVLDADTGDPVADQLVMALFYDAGSDTWLPEDDLNRTNASGYYELYDDFDYGPGEYRIEVRAEYPTYAQQVREGTWDGVYPLEFAFEIRAPRTIATGTITDAWTGDPIDSYDVGASFWDESTGEWYFVAGQEQWPGTGDNTYTLDEFYSFGAGVYRIYMTGPTGYLGQSIDVGWDGSEPIPLDFALVPDSAVPLATGTVTDALTTDPIEGAYVIAYFYDQAWNELLWVGEASTGVSGTYVVYDNGGFGAGEYHLEVTAPGYVAQQGSGWWDGATPITSDFALAPAAPLATGTVTDAVTTDPIEGGFVYAEFFDTGMDEWQWAGGASTAPDGTYTVYDEYGFGTGEYRFRAEAYAHLFEVQMSSWDGGDPLGIDFALEPASAVASGLVIDADTHGPIADANVSASWFDGVEYQWTAQAATDLDGGYTVYDENGYGAGEYELLVIASGYANQLGYDTWDGMAPLEMDFALSPPQPIATGLVTDADTTDPIEAAYIVASLYDAAMDEWLYAGDASSASDGTYTVYDMYSRGPGDYEIWAEAFGYVSQAQPITWHGGAALPVDFELAPAYPIASGWVTDALTTDPIDGAYVEAYRYNPAIGSNELAGEAYCDANGYYTVRDDAGFGPGDYTFVASAVGYVYQSQSSYWDGTELFPVNLALEPVMPVATGTVTDAGTADPIEGAYVAASWIDPGTSDWYWTGDAWTEADGSCTVYDTLGYGMGEYALSVTADGYVSQEAFGMWSGVTPLPLDFALSVALPVATGTVTDAVTTDPIYDAYVSASWFNGTWYEWVGETWTALDGTYTVYESSSYGPGEYEVYAESQGYRLQAEYGTWNGVTPMAIDLALSPLQVLATGTVTDAATTDPIAGAFVWAEFYDAGTDSWEYVSDTESDFSGAYTIYDYSVYGAGDYRFSAGAAGYVDQYQDLAWDGGDSLAVDFALVGLGADAYEVDDTYSQASSISTDGGVQEHTLYPAGDFDWVTFDAVAGTSYGIETFMTDVAATDTYLYLYEADGTTLISENDDIEPGDLFSRIEWTAPADQTVYAMVRHYDADSTGAYELSVTVLADAIANGQVTDAATTDSIEGARIEAFWYNPATELNELAGEAYTTWDGSYAVRDDMGLGAGDYTFVASAVGYAYQSQSVYWDGAAPLTVDFALSLQQPVATGTVTDAITADPIEGAYVEASWIDPGTGEAYWVGNTWTEADGTYVVSDSQGYGSGSYSVSVTAGDYAGAIQSGTWDGVTPFALDFALYRALATGTVTDAVTADPIEGAYVRAEYYDAGTGSWEYANGDWTAPDGTFTLSDESGRGADDYRFSVQAVGYVYQQQDLTWDGASPLTVDFALVSLSADSYEPDNSFDAANLIATDGTVQEHTLYPLSDHDWVTFEAVAGATYVIETSDIGDPGADTYLELYKADGTTLIDENDDIEPGNLFSRIEWTAPANQTVHAMVRHLSDGFGTGAYGLSVSSDAADTTPPTTTLAAAPASPNGQNGWYVTAPSITLTPNEAATTWYWWDSGTEAEYTGALTAPLGTHTLHYYSVDTATNDEAPEQATFKVDTATPSAATGLSVTALSTSALRLSWTAATDATSGIWQYSVRNAATDAVVGTTSGTTLDVTGLAADTTYSYYVLARDNAGWYGPESGDASGKTLAPPVGLTVTPIAGTNRVTTAIEASKLAFPAGADWVVIATAYNWPDALGGAALAGALDGPILLTSAGSLPAEVLAEITRLGAEKAVILGGTSAVGTAVEGALKTKLGSANVERIAGANRYETARLIAARTVAVLKASPGGYDGRAFVATGANFPDALGASPLAAKKGWPIYLVNPRGLDAATIAAMKTAGVTHAIVLGGTGAVPDAVKNGIGSGVPCTTERISGANRYATAVEVAKWGVANAGLAWNKLAIATGANFPDALAGGVLQGRSGSVLLLTPTATLDGTVKSTLTANKATISEVRFLGGTGAISNAVRTAVQNALK